MRRALRRDALVSVGLVAAVCVFALLAAERHAVALDLTRDQRHSLAPATLELLDRLDGPVDVHAYLPTHVQAPYNTVVRRMIDLLEAYRRAAGPGFRVQIHDPADPNLSAAELTALSAEARGYGVQAADLEVTIADRRTRQRVLFGVALLHRDKQVVVPPVERPETLEYEVTRALRDLTRRRAPVIGFSQGHGEPDVADSPLATLLSRSGTVRNVTLGPDAVPGDVDVLVVLAPTRPFGARERYLVEQHLLAGRALVALIDYRQQSTVFPDILVPVSSGLEPLLKPLGMAVDPVQTVVSDDNHAAPVHQQSSGRVVRQNHPAFPIARALAREHIVTRGLSHVVMPYASPIRVAGEARAVVRVEGRLRKSLRSLDPAAWPAHDAGDPAPHAVAATFAGSVAPSQPVTPRDDGQPERPPLKAAQGPARVFVATAGARMLAAEENGLLLLQNAIDWALAETDLVALRARSAEVPRLRPTTASTRAWIKYGNVLGPALILLLLGLVRWRRA